MLEYQSMSEYAERVYGKKLYKLSIDAGFSCPNRDGMLDTRGCIFCDGSGSGSFAGINRDASGIHECSGRNYEIVEYIKEQIEAQKRLISNKLPKTKQVGYIAYFQAFTNTYAPVERLKEVYKVALEDVSIDVISIATRPDCLPEEVIGLLQEMNKKKPVWIELGLQSIHEKTAEYIRRGYTLQVYDEAVFKLKRIGISQIITHLIIGLPGETKEDILQSVDYVVASGCSGIKLQLLHVLKGTDLANEYVAGKFETLTLEEYVNILRECVEHIPYEIVIHRLTGDGDKRNLIAPLWSADKKAVRAKIDFSFHM